MKEIVYKITCTATDKSYVGRTKRSIEERLKGHFCEANNYVDTFLRPLHLDIRKYGKDCFIIEQIGTIEGDDIFQLNLKEKEFIVKNNTFFPYGYNVSGLEGDDLKLFKEWQKIWVEVGGYYG